MIFLFEVIVCLETKNMLLVPLMHLDGRCDVPPPCDKREKLLAVEISQVALLGPDRRVWRDDLDPVCVLMNATAVATVGIG